jgi:hypothetical protein
MGRRWGHLLSERQGNDPEAEQHAADLHATLVKAHVVTIAYPGRVEHRVHPPPPGAVDRGVSACAGTSPPTTGPGATNHCAPTPSWRATEYKGIRDRFAGGRGDGVTFSP